MFERCFKLRQLPTPLHEHGEFGLIEDSFNASQVGRILFVARLHFSLRNHVIAKAEGTEALMVDKRQKLQGHDNGRHCVDALDGDHPQSEVAFLTARMDILPMRFQ